MIAPPVLLILPRPPGSAARRGSSLKPIVHEITAKSALNRSKGLRADWTLNPYRGCAHACRYCYARATHQYLELGPGADFDQVLFAKLNIAEVLRRELARPGWRAGAGGPRQSVTIGTAADPYQPIDGRYRLTRGCLEAIAEAAVPCGLLTKGTLVVRDVDVLAAIAARSRLTVHFSLSTVDPTLARALEPSAPPPASRLRALERLRANGIDARVLLCPVIPGLTDAPAQIEEVIRAAADHGASGLDAGPLRLAPLVKEHFLSYLATVRPQLVPAYRRGYCWGADPPRAYAERLARLVAETKDRVGFADRPPARVEGSVADLAATAEPQASDRFEQLALLEPTALLNGIPTSDGIDESDFGN